jgi:Tfp pilus assembly protein PilW
MTLIELMVALAIGAFLMIGAITVFMQSRTTFRITESVARMQENARFALETIEPDIRMAHYWGLSTDTVSIQGRVAPAAGNNFGRTPCPAATGPRVLDVAIGGTNNAYGFTGCPTGAFSGAQPNADSFVVRRVSEDFETPPLSGASILRLQSMRSPAESLVFTGTAVPGGIFTATNSQTHRLVANGYYVDRSSTLLGATVPSLRAKMIRLTDGAITDQEIVSGVEDLQVELGLDMDPDGDNSGSIDRYVDINDPLVDPADAAFNPDAVVLAVRIWVRVRAERAENGFTDTTNYVYADQDVGPFNDNFRRIVVSKTIYLRNARPIPAMG